MLTPAMQSALDSAAAQLVVGKTKPGAYSTPVTGGSSFCRISSLRALASRGLLAPVDGYLLEAYELTPAGLRVAEAKIKELCAEAQAEAEASLASPYVGIQAMGETALAGVEEVLTTLEGVA